MLGLEKWVTMASLGVVSSWSSGVYSRKLEYRTGNVANCVGTMTMRTEIPLPSGLLISTTLWGMAHENDIISLCGNVQ